MTSVNQVDLKEFRWLNEAPARFEGDALVITAPARTDYFRSPGAADAAGLTSEATQNAPFCYTKVQGDFVMRVRVQHAFRDTYDAATIMVMQSETVWAKACFELTDFDTHAVVSVVTNGVSDDANGCNLDRDEVWLQVARVGQSFAFYYSVDGALFFMMRHFFLPVDATVKVGLVAQAPRGDGGDRYYRDLSIVQRTVKNIRTGE
jgi:regulation of enolase protein 1 (concanavalin A-like superfamily)